MCVGRKDEEEAGEGGEGGWGRREGEEGGKRLKEKRDGGGRREGEGGREGKGEEGGRAGEREGGLVEAIKPGRRGFRPLAPVVRSGMGVCEGGPRRGGELVMGVFVKLRRSKVVDPSPRGGSPEVCV